MTLFDAYLMVDWSARGVPTSGRDSVWIACCERGRTEPILENPRTRGGGCRRVRELLCQLVEEQKRVLASFDFPYGYPSGFAAGLSLTGSCPPWHRIWEVLRERIHDSDDNANDRFCVAADLNRLLGDATGPFWGCPAPMPDLPRTRPSFPYRARGSIGLAEFRETERLLADGGRRPQSVWKLFGAGAVGSQALVGMPRISALRDDPVLGSYSRVWPFETGFIADPTDGRIPCITHAEIWPGALPVDLSLHPVRDAAQVLSLASYFAALDADGRLRDLFTAPRSLAPEALRACVDEEGWILGA